MQRTARIAFCFLLAASLGGWRQGIHVAGRTQGQSTFMDVGFDYRYVNLMKTGGAWFYCSAGNLHPPPSELDSNGYPTSPIHAGGDCLVFYGPSQAQNPGHQVAKWSGHKKIQASQNAGGGTLATVTCKNGDNSNGTSTANSCDATDGRWEISVSGETAPNAVQWNLGIITTDGAVNTNLAFFSINDEASFGWCAIGPSCLNGWSGDPIGTLYKSRIRAGNFAVWRDLDGTLANTANCTTWATRKPMTYAFYNGSELRPSLYAGDAAYTLNGSSNDYSATFGSGGPSSNRTVIVHFNNDATTSTATFNLNGTGAIPIANTAGGTTLSSGQRPANFGYGTLVYEPDLNAWMLFAGTTTSFYGGLNCGEPPEMFLILCAELGLQPWFPEFALAADPITDYATQLATYIKNTYPSMVPRFEIFNEPWNYNQPLGGSFGDNKANVFWGTTFGHQDWDCKIASLLGQAVNAVYGDATKYKVIIGVQTTTTPSASNNVLACTQFLAQAAPAQPGYVKSASYNWITGVAIATYWSPNPGGAAGALAGPTYIGYVGPTYQYSLASDTSFLTSLVGTDQGAAWGTIAANWKSWAAGFKAGLQVDGYEGGFNITKVSADVTQTITAATNANPAVLTVAANSSVAGQTVKITGATGGTWSTINGNSYTVQAGGTSTTIPINLDSTGLGALTSATLTWTGSQTYINAAIAPMYNLAIVGTYTTSIYHNVLASGMEYPSMYVMSGDFQGSPGTIYGAWYPGIYGLTNSATDPGTPQWNAISSFNHSTN